MMANFEIRNHAGECLDYQFDPGKRMNVLVVLGHGVTGNKDRPLLVAMAEGLSKLGWPCLRFSFSGNGSSEGRFVDSCVTKGVGDLQAVLDSIPDTASVVFVGHSMGGAVGVLTAARDIRIRALVSVAGMTHTAAFVEREFGDVTPGEGLMWDEPDCPLSKTFVDDLGQIGSTLDAAAAVAQPWLLIHGGDDDVVPVQDGREAFEAAIGQKEWVEIPGAGHLFGEESYPKLVASVDGFLAKLFP
jgi:pimeloyl-ACP methyl ester carboxylesterase